MERSFQIAYGREQLSSETREAFLFSQLQAGLKLPIMESPAVSGSMAYKPLCVAAKQEEKRLLELCQWKQEDWQVKSSEFRYSSSTRQVSQSYAPPDLSVGRPPHECYICGSLAHIAKQCKQRKSESSSDSKNITDSKKTKANWCSSLS